MLLTLIENTKLKRYFISKLDQVNLIFSCVKILYKNNDYYIEAINNYFFSDGSYRKILKDGFFKLKNDDLLYEIKIHIVMNLDKYEYYLINTENFMSFNGDCNCVVSFIGSKKYFVIESGIIKSNYDCFVNGRKYKNQILRNLDVVDFDIYRLIYTKRICLFSKYLSILNINFKRPLNINNLKIKKVEYKYRYYPELEKPKLNIKLKEYRNINKKDHKNSFLTLGPMLTMSFISVVISFFNAFLASEKGRSIIELLPMIIYPISMFISLILWQSINYFYNKRSIKKLELKNKIEYKNYLKKIENEILSFNSKLNDYYKNLFLSIKDLKEIEENGKLYFSNLKQERFWFINVGRGFKKRENIFFDYQDKNFDFIKEFIKKYSEVDNELLFIDLKKCNFLTINLLSDKHLFYYIYSQLSFKINSNEVKFALYISKKQLESFKFFFYDDHFIYNEKRLIFTSSCQLEINAKHIIIFVFDEDLITNYIENATYIFVYFERKINKRSDALIVCNNFNGQFHSSFSNFNFYYEPFSLDIFDLFKKLENFELKNNIFKKKIITFKDVYKNVEVPKNNLIAYLGYDENNKVISLDLSEKSDGPHGIIAGSTGSGKSVLILNICLSLAYNYSPDYLNLAIVDFKGGGVINFLKNNNLNLPHLVSCISNIDNIDYHRVLSSFRYECFKRQKLFKELSLLKETTINDIDDYMFYYDEKYGLEKKAHLVIIIDEFAEVKKQFPDFVKEVISLARVGRSLGIHLILSTQKPSGVIDDQIRSNINFKICLKVNDKQDSIEVIDSNLAYFLKDVGSFYLVSNKELKKGFSMYCNGDINNSHLLKVDLLKYDLTAYKTKFLNITNKILESDVIVRKIMKKYCKFKKENFSLWLDEPSLVKISDYFKNSNEKIDNLLLGICDDYEYKRQYLAKLNYKENSFVYTLSEENKNSLLRTIIYSCYKMSNFFDTIIINISNNKFESFKDICGIKEIIRDEERIEYLFRVLKNRSYKIKKPLLIIIDNLYNFNNLHEENSKILKYLLQSSLEHNFKFLLFSNNISDINYRSLTFIKQKVVLNDISNDDFLTIFNMKKIKEIKKNQGYYAKERLLKFYIFLNENFKYRKDYSELTYFKKTILIPKISLVEKQILIGVDKDFFDYIYVDIKGEIIITGFDYNLVYQFYLKVFKLLKDLDVNLKFIMFNDIKLNGEEEKLFDKKVLFIGPGINKQFLFSFSSKRELMSNEAIYFFKEKRIRFLYGQ